jgi:hypothetical protein
MLSEKQLEANRANAQKSTGPRTADGKKRSSLNATRHGFTGQTVVLPEEDLVAFNTFTKGIVESFTPVAATEIQLAQSYAGYQWRINRLAAVETTMFTLGLMEDNAENLNIEHPQIHIAASYAKTFRSQAAEFGRLAMYNQRLENSASKVLKQLKELQTARRQREQHEMVEAARIYQLNKMQSLPFDPKQNGFDLTIGQIQEYIRHRNQRNQATEAEKVDFNRVAWTKRQQKVAA